MAIFIFKKTYLNFFF